MKTIRHVVGSIPTLGADDPRNAVRVNGQCAMLDNSKLRKQVTK